ncbi:MAG: class I SAM-dependent methyltransferase [Phycisphaerales bacterium]|nr:class I SAM-dependent methyltransferase [Phycisphaerales bacterium]
MPTTTQPTSTPSAAGDLNPQLLEVLQSLAQALERQSLQQEVLWKQGEALNALLAFIRPDALFPPTRGWAASPDFLKLLAELIMTTRPESVVEASSGVTTLTAAYCLKRLGRGRVTALEHDETYAARTSALICEHGLEDFATVVHAPLSRQAVDGEEFAWYDPKAVTAIAQVDLLVVDGPPARTGPLARYPALPMFANALQAGATILADDGGRAPEQEMVRRWMARFPGLQAEFIELEKGAFRLRWP